MSRFPSPCRGCGGDLYGPVRFCPFCGIATPLQTAEDDRPRPVSDDAVFVTLPSMPAGRGPAPDSIATALDPPGRRSPAPDDDDPPSLPIRFHTRPPEASPVPADDRPSAASGAGPWSPPPSGSAPSGSAPSGPPTALRTRSRAPARGRGIGVAGVLILILAIAGLVVTVASTVVDPDRLRGEVLAWFARLSGADSASDAGGGTWQMVQLIAPTDGWVETGALPRGSYVTIDATGRVAVVNGLRPVTIPAGDQNWMGDGLDRAFKLRSLEDRPVQVRIYVRPPAGSGS